MRTSITYRLPGGLRATYEGTPKPLWMWIAVTWIGGVALWRLWFREAFYQLSSGHLPWPTRISQAVATHIKRVFDRFREAAPTEH